MRFQDSISQSALPLAIQERERPLAYLHQEVWWASLCQTNESRRCRTELWAEGTGGGVVVVCVCVCVWVFGGGVEGGVGVCLCGIRQWLGCMTRATRKFPVWSSSLARGRRQHSWQVWETFSACLVSKSTVSKDCHWLEESGKMKKKK